MPDVQQQQYELPEPDGGTIPARLAAERTDRAWPIGRIREVVEEVPDVALILWELYGGRATRETREDFFESLAPALSELAVLVALPTLKDDSPLLGWVVTGSPLAAASSKASRESYRIYSRGDLEEAYGAALASPPTPAAGGRVDYVETFLAAFRRAIQDVFLAKLGLPTGDRVPPELRKAADAYSQQEFLELCLPAIPVHESGGDDVPPPSPPTSGGDSEGGPDTPATDAGMICLSPPLEYRPPDGVGGAGSGVRQERERSGGSAEFTAELFSPDVGRFREVYQADQAAAHRHVDEVGAYYREIVGIVGTPASEAPPAADADQGARDKGSAHSPSELSAQDTIETLQSLHGRDAIQKFLDEFVVGRSWGDFEENYKVADGVSRHLQDEQLRVMCPGKREKGKKTPIPCGEPALLRCYRTDTAPPGFFRLEHYKGGKTFQHAGSRAIPTLSLIPAPPDARRRKIE